MSNRVAKDALKKLGSGIFGQYIDAKQIFRLWTVTNTYDNRPALSFPHLSMLTPNFLSNRIAIPLVLFGDI